MVLRRNRTKIKTFGLFLITIAALSFTSPSALTLIAQTTQTAHDYDALGRKYLQDEQYQRALEVNRKASELAPGSAVFLQRIALSLIELGQIAEALRHLERAWQLDPKSYSTAYWTGLAYWLLDDRPAAEEWLQRASTLRSDATSPDVVRTYMDLAEGNLQQAKERGEKLLAFTSSSPYPRFAVADVALFGKDLNSARVQYEKALKSDADARNGLMGRYIRTSLAYIDWKQGRKDEARELFSQSLEKLQQQMSAERDSQGYPFEAALIYAIQGNKAKAYEWLQRAIRAGWRKYSLAMRDPMLESLRGDKQFRKLMAQVREMVNKEREQANRARTT